MTVSCSTVMHLAFYCFFRHQVVEMKDTEKQWVKTIWHRVNKRKDEFFKQWEFNKCIDWPIKSPNHEYESLISSLNWEQICRYSWNWNLNLTILDTRNCMQTFSNDSFGVLDIRRTFDAWPLISLLGFCNNS